MPSEEKITRANAMDLIRRFAKEYRKTLGKSPAEIIIVGGGSIMLNYKFRDATQDFDVILRAASGIKQYRRDGSSGIIQTKKKTVQPHRLLAILISILLE